MNHELAARFRPVAPPRVIEDAYSEDQHRRLLGVVRDHGPWPLILAHHFRSPEEVLATTSGDVPEGVKLTWDMFLSPVFRGYLARGGVCLFREIEDCYYNSRFLDLVRGYWGAKYAEPESMLFNIQGPCSAGGAPHIDGTRFRGVTMENTPTWLLNTMCKSGLFERWRARKAQVIAWYYRGRIGGGFDYWPDGPHGEPRQIPAPMWGRAVVVENEMMYHAAQSNGPAALRRPEGLAIDSRFSADPERAEGWRITTGDRVVQRIPAEEMRFLVHWGAQVYLDDEELRVAQDHTDDLGHERVFEIFLADLRARGEKVAMPSDPFTDKAFIRLLNRVYDLGTPSIRPPEPGEERVTDAA
jgi:hypothetical protein